ncbi:unnamed protein product [Moneuplotes crassus]|uniref:N-acetyltransferase domain-containing protein n=1 Tax=Euplotes crassus TaxID=5936 RepID=A0AAD1XRD1_EUPCR|nr:unnamed protein product [Moneuplotes crassus]
MEAKEDQIQETPEVKDNGEGEQDEESKKEKVIEVTAEESAKYYDAVKSREEVKHTNKDLKVDFRQLTEHNVGSLKVLLDRTLPVSYRTDFYNKLVSYQRYSKLAYFKDILIGAITCKSDKQKIEKDDEEKHEGVYIMTITVFPKYRRYGIASKLLEEAIKDCCTEWEYIFLDVQENNVSALEFYKKHGFEVSHKRVDYYTNIEPSDSYFLYKKISSE